MSGTGLCADYRHLRSGGSGGRPQKGCPYHRCRSGQARHGAEEEVRPGREYPRPGRVARPLVRLRAPHPDGSRCQPAWPGRRDAKEEELNAPGELAEAGLRLDLGDEAATITLCRPDRLNAQTPQLWLMLREIGRTLSGAVRVVVVRGEGRSFSAGLDRAAFMPNGLPDGQSLADIGQ